LKAVKTTPAFCCLNLFIEFSLSEEIIVNNLFVFLSVNYTDSHNRNTDGNCFWSSLVTVEDSEEYFSLASKFDALALLLVGLGEMSHSSEWDVEN